jgi:2-oxoglutarate ferredoxin oxidoreductase subunit delta
MSAVRKLQTEGKQGQNTQVLIASERCKGCGICTAFCPVGMLALGDTLNSNGYPVVTLAEGKACRGCGRCYLMCPDLVFTLLPGGDGP